MTLGPHSGVVTAVCDLCGAYFNPRDGVYQPRWPSQHLLGDVQDVHGGRRSRHRGGCWNSYPRRPQRRGVTVKKTHDYICHYRGY